MKHITEASPDDLAQAIRFIDGNHDKGAGAIAEALRDYFDFTPAPQPEGDTMSDRAQTLEEIRYGYNDKSRAYSYTYEGPDKPWVANQRAVWGRNEIGFLLEEIDLLASRNAEAFEAGRREGAEIVVRNEIEWWEQVRQDHGRFIMTLRDARLKELRALPTETGTTK